jgi:thioredoxin reductase (NADPH)
VATGARYNRLPLERLSEFEGAGVFYAATQMEAQMCTHSPAVVVGGGNSAGQAALFLARTSSSVHIVIRGDSLARSMSRYLIDQIEHHPLIEVLPHSEVTRLEGDSELSGVEIRDNVAGTTLTLNTCGIFVFIGAKPATDWLEGQLAVDTRGFVLTGTDLPDEVIALLEQPPLLLETSRPGIFAVGDVRSGSVKRAATAIGEGSMAVRLVFDRLQTTGLAVAAPAPLRSAR